METKLARARQKSDSCSEAWDRCPNWRKVKEFRGQKCHELRSQDKRPKHSNRIVPIFQATSFSIFSLLQVMALLEGLHYLHCCGDWTKQGEVLENSHIPRWSIAEIAAVLHFLRHLRLRMHRCSPGFTHCLLSLPICCMGLIILHRRIIVSAFVAVQWQPKGDLAYLEALESHLLLQNR